MAQTSNNALGVDNTFRRKFDREEYLERARSAKDSKRPPVQRKPLKHRDYEVDLESCLGKTQVRYTQTVSGNGSNRCECTWKRIKQKNCI
ncbi:zinc finger matrin-type protein 2-like [Morus notabilis]|uniref:zinc finger matrin-type protein 2-like n=1 Tax=Morus notabilis TaxID=981085 RepID=UPI000CED109F|nr:zinc finger matrin-type protein 2-like [Morus notabilis]